jgi:hypothetical protein
MEKLIGRDKETALLDKYMTSDCPEFIAIYGRRRVGKTFLVRRHFHDQFDFYVTGIINGTFENEMEAFNMALKRYGHNGPDATTWMQAFAALGDLLKKKSDHLHRRCIVFIDELPCFETRNSGFIRALDHFWNSQAAWIDKMMLIVCGSATSWMIRNVINNRGGLHNRVTHEIHLKPFTLHQTEQFFVEHGSNWDRLSILQIYMAMGGVPYYLGRIDTEYSAAENIDRLFFDDMAEMREEYNRLFLSLFRQPEKYMDVVKLLSQYKKGLTRKEIAEKLKLPNNGHLGDMLEDLQYCDFIRQYNNGNKTNNSIYQLIDFYTLFYHQFCRRPKTDRHYWRNTIGTPTQNTWYGLAYERVCTCHIQQIIYTLRLDYIHTEFYSWRSKTSTPAAQIDIVIDRADGIVTICEVKYSKAEYTLPKDEYEKIMNRVEAFVTETKCKKGTQVVIITTKGMKPHGYSEISRRTITLDNLFIEMPE